MRTLIIPAYRITYVHFMRNIILFGAFWLLVLAISLFQVLENNFSTFLSTSIFITILLLDTTGFVMFIRRLINDVEHAVDCRISEEGLTLTSTDDEKPEKEMFIPYSDLFGVERVSFPFDKEKFYLRIWGKKKKEEVLVYSDEVGTYDFNEAEKFIKDKLTTGEEPTSK